MTALAHAEIIDAPPGAMSRWRAVARVAAVAGVAANNIADIG